MSVIVPVSPTKERPLPLPAQDILAILNKEKIQFRRLIICGAENMQRQGHTCIRQNPPGDPWYKDYVWSMRGDSGVWHDYKHERFLELCPYGKVGERLWVKEPWAVSQIYDGVSPRDIHPGAKVAYPISGGNKGLSTRAVINMPRWASRLLLEITQVVPERLQSITEADCIAEGCRGGHDSIPGYPFSAQPKEQFRWCWDRTTTVPAFKAAANPWVWAISFKIVEGAA